MDKQILPTEIVELIASADEEINKLVEEQAAKRSREQEEREAAQQREAQEFFLKVLPMIPDVIQPYVHLTGVSIKDDQYGLHWSERGIEFHVPGLAPILAVFTEEKDGVSFDGWKFSVVVETTWDDETDLCKEAAFSFRKGSVQKSEVNQVLRWAREIYVEHEETQIRLDRQLANYQINKSRREKEKLQEEASQDAEEMALLNSIKDDPIAIHLLKIFILLRDERNGFEQRITDMDETMYSIENRWSRKAEDLCRQADEAKRRADREKTNLQDELDDAEAKLNKAQRGW